MHSSDRLSSNEGLLPRPWFVILIALLAMLGLYQAMSSPVNGDASWYLYMAGRILDGARPYEDIVDTNPPLIVWLNELLVGLARELGASALAAFRVLLLVLTALSLGLSWRLSRELPLAFRQAGLLTWLYLLLIHAGGIAGQREHILLILILPYAYGAVAEVCGVRAPLGLGLISGLMAGVGFALKPFFVPAAIAVELFLMFRCHWQSWKRPQALALGAVVFAYVVAIVIGAPQYLAVARRFAPLYPHHMPGGPMLLASSWRLGVVVLAIVSAYALARREVPGWSEVFGLLALGLTASVYLTGKGWRYHWFPSIAIAGALLGGCGAFVAFRRQAAYGRTWPGALFGLGLVVLSALSVTDSVVERRRDTDAIRLVRRYARNGKAVLVFSPWVHQSFPMINETGATWGMRHPMLWQIAAFYANDAWVKGRYHALDAMSDPERRFLSEITEDFERFQPGLLLVNDDPPTPALPGFDYLEYMRREPRFAQALVHYEYATRTPSFRVYRRRDEHVATVGLKSAAPLSR
jgi:hypothetical protein